MPDKRRYSLVDERRRLQRVIGPLLPQEAIGHAPQLVVDEHQQFLHRRRIAVVPAIQQAGDVPDLHGVNRPQFNSCLPEVIGPRPPLSTWRVFAGRPRHV